MAFSRKLFHIGAADAPVVGNALRGVKLVHRLVAIAFLPAQAFSKRRGKAQRLAGQHGRADGNRRHGLHAARQHHILRAAHHGLRGKMHGLLARTALAIDGGAGHAIGLASGQPAGAGDVASQCADGVDAAKNHIIVFISRNGIALDHGGDDMGTQISAMHCAQ